MDKKETVNGRLELKKLNESKDLSDHSSVTMETKATKNTVCQKAFNREEFYHGQANSGEEAESNEIEQAFLSTSGRESTSMVDVMLLGDFKGGGGNSTVPVSPSVKVILYVTLKLLLYMHVFAIRKSQKNKTDSTPFEDS